MLEFEDEMKHVKRGYVVLSLDEYDDLRDQIAEASMKAYEAEQLANRRIAEAAANNKAITDSLFKVEQKNYGKNDIEVVFDRHVLHALAVDKLHATFSAEELEGYVVKPAANFILCDETLAVRAAAPDDTED